MRHVRLPKGRAAEGGGEGVFQRRATRVLLAAWNSEQEVSRHREMPVYNTSNRMLFVRGQ